MAKHSDAKLDALFSAMADPTRRAVIVRLADGPAAVKELAEPHGMALSSFLKHITVLERSGLVTSSKRGRVRTCSLNPNAFHPAESWMASQRRRKSGRIDGLANLLDGLRAESS